MFNEVTCREKLLPSSIRFVTRIFIENMQTSTETTEFADLGEKKLGDATN